MHRAARWALALCALAGLTLPVPAQPVTFPIFGDDEEPEETYRVSSRGYARDGDELLLVEGLHMPLEPSHAFVGAHSGLLRYRHMPGGWWEMIIDPPERTPGLDLQFDSLVLYVNGPAPIEGGELPWIAILDGSDRRSAARALSVPENVRVASYGFTPASTTNALLDVAYQHVLPADHRRPGYPEDLSIRFFDEPVDTSVAGIGAPAVPARFRVEMASGLQARFRYRDVDGDGTISRTDEYIDVLLPESEGGTDRLAWRVTLAGTTDDLELNPPGEGDVFDVEVAFEAFDLDGDPDTWQRISIPTRHLVDPGFGGVEPGFDLSRAQSVALTPGAPNAAERTLWVDAIALVKNDDDAFLEMVQRATFDYFWHEANPSNGLVRDRSRPTSASSIAAVGFGLSAYTVGIDRGWITREEGRARVRNTLRFLWTAPQNNAPDATGYRGFFYHFLNMTTGRRAGTNELSTIDTALLIAGVLHMRQYFSEDVEIEGEIRDLADAIYERVDWRWAQARPPLISHGWFPDPAGRSNADPQTGFIVHDWNGYNEAMILYILALGSPTYPVGPEAWDAWTAGYQGQWQTHYGYSFLTFPPLFGHQYSHVWIDFRDIQDAYMRERGIDYFENSRRATLAQRAYHAHNPRGWPNYSAYEWGLTASDTPTGYRARGAPPAQNDDGTLVPTAPGGSIVFTPTESTAALRHMYGTYADRLWGPYGFRDAYNVSVDWFDDDYIGIDQGPILLMIENLRTERIWESFMQHEAVRRGLDRAGFVHRYANPVEQPVARNDHPSLELFPNPVSDRLTVQFSGAADGLRMTLFDALGRRIAVLVNLLASSGIETFELQTTHLPAGMYFVRAETGGRTLVRAFVRVP